MFTSTDSASPRDAGEQITEEDQHTIDSIYNDVLEDTPEASLPVEDIGEDIGHANSTIDRYQDKVIKRSATTIIQRSHV